MGTSNTNCKECEYVTTTPTSLKIHKEMKHENVRYSCEECEYGATPAYSLKHHKESKHKRVRSVPM